MATRMTIFMFVSRCVHNFQLKAPRILIVMERAVRIAHRGALGLEVCMHSARGQPSVVGVGMLTGMLLPITTELVFRRVPAAGQGVLGESKHRIG